MTDNKPVPDDDRGNDVNEDFSTLLDGVRTSLPGVEVLFGFLLILPLQGGFADLTGAERTAFATAFYTSGLATSLLIAPSIHQRVRAPDTGLRRQSKHHLVITTWVTIVGSVLMGVALAATTYLVSSLAFHTGPAALATVGFVFVVFWSWFYLPLVTFRNHR